MTIKLTPKLQDLVHKRARQKGLDPSAYVAQVLSDALGVNGEGDAAQHENPRKPISERFEKIRRQLSPEERQALDDLPSDFAAEHDHYIYGAPKQYS